MRILLVGCGKQKQAVKCPAKDLYVGNLFKARRKFAEQSGHTWFIVSALYGLVLPDDLAEPYDKVMPTQRHAFTRWADKFRNQFTSTMSFPGPLTLEVHAGADYVAPIRLAMWPWPSVTVEHPVFGMGIGEQIAFYKSLTLKPA